MACQARRDGHGPDRRLNATAGPPRRNREGFGDCSGRRPYASISGDRAKNALHRLRPVPPLGPCTGAAPGPIGNGLLEHERRVTPFGSAIPDPGLDPFRMRPGRHPDGGSGSRRVVPARKDVGGLAPTLIGRGKSGRPQIAAMPSKRRAPPAVSVTKRRACRGSRSLRTARMASAGSRDETRGTALIRELRVSPSLQERIRPG